MRKMMLKLWQDDAGIVALEYLLVATIVGLGLVVGLSNLEIALDTELTELANAITALDQGYSFAGVMGSGTTNTSMKTGSQAIDINGTQTITATPPTSPSVISIAVP